MKQFLILFKNVVEISLEIVNFVSFPNANLQEMPDHYIKSMNSDYRTLYDLSIAVKKGHVSEALANRTIGVCHQAR